MSKSSKIQRTKKAMLEALNKHLGIVSRACAEVGINRTTHYRYYNEDKDYAQAVDAVQDVALDFAEGALFGQIKEGNTTATIFYLKTKGKKRGYIERTEITGADGKDFSFNVNLSKTNSTPRLSEPDGV